MYMCISVIVCMTIIHVHCVDHVPVKQTLSPLDCKWKDCHCRTLSMVSSVGVCVVASTVDCDHIWPTKKVAIIWRWPL